MRYACQSNLAANMVLYIQGPAGSQELAWVLPVPLPAWLMAGTSGLKKPNPWARRDPPSRLWPPVPSSLLGDGLRSHRWYLKKRTQVLL